MPTGRARRPEPPLGESLLRAAGVLAMAALLLGAAGATGARAAHFDFAMTFDGTDATLDPGSDVPAGTAISPGDFLNPSDTFTVTVRAAGDAFWRFDGPEVSGLPLTFFVQGSATRTGDATSTFFRDGDVVHSIFEDHVSQQFVHVGAENWSLAPGLEFDTVVLFFHFLGSTGLTTIQDSADILGFTPFFRDPEFSFVDGPAPVPLPAALPLFGAALAAIGLVGRRRRRAAA